MSQPRSIGIVGGGAWGTALGQVLATAGRAVVLWARDAAVVEEINVRHRNSSRLPGIELSPALRATARLDAVAAADVVLLAVPAQQTRTMARELAPLLLKRRVVIITAKGLEQATGLRLSEVLADELPSIEPAVLSGPSLAVDCARGLPTAVTLATADDDIGRDLAESLSTRTFRIYRSSDLTGVELGGAVKNVLAIAAGIVAGRALGASAHAALVTRGFAEMSRLLVALGARHETLVGLSCMGDLVLTASSRDSRNMSLGVLLGEGQPLDTILAGRRAVSEGVMTAAAVVRLARQTGIDMPIAMAVDDIVAGRASVDEAIARLLARPLKAE